MEPPKRILVCVLDWGLGHATRCIPLIKELQRRNCVVFIASSGRAYELLKKEFFMVIRCFEIDGYDPVYPYGDGMAIKMAAQLPKFLRIIGKEQVQIEKIVERNQIDMVISDNRYGCYSTKVPSYFITHQLNIQMPGWLKWMEAKVNQKNHEYIKKYAECWIPAPEDSLIPMLTKNTDGLNVRHIGYLSRFAKKQTEKKYDVIGICSGPEPQRTLLEEVFTYAFKKTKLQVLMVSGKTESLGKYNKTGHRFSIANCLTGDDLNEAIQQSDIVVARSGYSTVMDLAKLGKKAIFIPTPGQTEQEYLAKQLMEMGIAFSMAQDDFDLEIALKESEKYTGFVDMDYDNTLLQKAVDSIL